MKIQILRISSSAVLLAALFGAPVHAEETPAAVADGTGFYGGVAVRASGTDTSGIRFGGLWSVWNKFALPIADDSGARSLAYGGFRWGNDLAFEAAVATSDRLPQVPDTLATRRGVGLTLASSDISAQIRNVDLYTTWGFAKAFSVYGRLGYKETDTVAFYPAPNAGNDGRRNHDGVNYGVGLRYDMTPVLGLRVEYARFGRVPGESLATPFGETDQLQLGLQFRF